MEETQTHVGDLRAKVAQTLEEVHDLALELCPRLLDDLGLVAALRHYPGEFRDRYRIPVDLQIVGLGEKRLPARVETALYRVAQQALVNVARHAQAQSVGVLLEDRGSLVVLVVEDDGIGFDVEEVMGSHVLQSNLGLYGMRERASLLGGRLTIESSTDGGTFVFVEVPLDREEHVRPYPRITCSTRLPDHRCSVRSSPLGCQDDMMMSEQALRGVPIIMVTSIRASEYRGLFPHDQYLHINSWAAVLPPWRQG